MQSCSLLKRSSEQDAGVPGVQLNPLLHRSSDVKAASPRRVAPVT